MGLFVTHSFRLTMRMPTIDLTAIVKFKLAWQSQGNKAPIAALRKSQISKLCMRGNPKTGLFFFCPFLQLLFSTTASLVLAGYLRYLPQHTSNLLCNCSVDKVLFLELGAVWPKMASLEKGASAIKCDTPVALLPNNPYGSSSPES